MTKPKPLEPTKGEWEEVRTLGGKCGYCYNTSETLRAVRLRTFIGAPWQEVKLVCLACRRYLTGVHFRYEGAR